MIKVLWARKGTRFTMLFEEVAIVLVREMPVLAASRIIGIDDKALWRIVSHYVERAMNQLDLSEVAGNGLFQAARRRARGYRDVETFITMIYLLAAPIEHVLQFHTK